MNKFQSTVFAIHRYLIMLLQCKYDMMHMYITHESFMYRIMFVNYYVTLLRALLVFLSFIVYIVNIVYVVS